MGTENIKIKSLLKMQQGRIKLRLLGSDKRDSPFTLNIYHIFLIRYHIFLIRV